MSGLLCCLHYFEAAIRYRLTLSCWCRYELDPGCRFPVTRLLGRKPTRRCDFNHFARGQSKSAAWVKRSSAATFWGVESDFGSNLGDFSTIDALSTLAFEGRRAQWAQAELIAALKILQSHDIDRAQMLGSWAGAMGQTQFMPTMFLAYAVDADGDGRRDLWGSIADVMASTANFVVKSGWQVGESWGVEVRLPVGFDFVRADMDVRLPSSGWAKQGVQSMDGSPLPALTDCSIILPAGARGPAFMVGNNFRTILRYNNSTSYALAVGLLAQHLSGGTAVQAPWPRDVKTMNSSQLQALQIALNEQGIDSGPPDGLVGTATQRAIRQYQQRQGLAADGYPSLELLQRLLDNRVSKP